MTLPAYGTMRDVEGVELAFQLAEYGGRACLNLGIPSYPPVSVEDVLRAADAGTRLVVSESAEGARSRAGFQLQLNERLFSGAAKAECDQAVCDESRSLTFPPEEAAYCADVYRKAIEEAPDEA